MGGEQGVCHFLPFLPGLSCYLCAQAMQSMLSCEMVAVGGDEGGWSYGPRGDRGKCLCSQAPRLFAESLGDGWIRSLLFLG